MARSAKKSVSTRGWSLSRKLAFRSRRARNGCLLWKGLIAANGRGRIWWKGRFQSVCRLAFEESKRRRIPSGKMVLHYCKVITCIEPKHLYLGSQAAVTGQTTRLLGEAHPNHKLTSQQVKKIRASRESQAADAALFGVCRKTISLIRRRRAWTHV